MKVLIRSFVDDISVISGIIHRLRDLEAEALLWGESFTPLNPNTNERYSFEDRVRSVDAAIIVLGGKQKQNALDDLMEHVGRETLNYECALMSGMLTPDNCCFVITNEKVNIPSNLMNFRKIYLDHETSNEDLSHWIRSIKLKKNKINNSSLKTPFIVTLETALSHVVNEQNDFNHVRVFALSAIKSAGLLSNSFIKMGMATVLLREFTIVDEFLQESMEETIDKSIEIWEMMNKQGVIGELNVMRFDFHPTTELYIFDNRYVILGNVYFDLKNGEYTFDNEEVLLIDSSSDGGAIFIDKCITHFDKLAEIYRV